MIPLLNSGVEDDSPTSDEWAHFVRGVSFWTTGDTRLSFAHPPLANAIAGLPFAFADPDEVQDLTQFQHWDEGFVIGIYTEYTRHDYAKARAELVRARRVMFVFPLALVAYVYWFCFVELGWKTAAAASILLAFNPNVLAHGSLVTTDLPAALGWVVATGEFARYLRGPPSIGRLVSMALAVAFAVLVKHSGILLIPALGAIGVVAAFKGWGVFAGPTRKADRFKRYAGHIAATTLIIAVAVNAGYRFNDTGMRVDELLAKPEPQYWISKPYKHELLERRTPLRHLPDAVRVPLPYTHVFGLTCIGAQNKRGWFRSYFWGRKRPNDGHWAYFPVLMLVKTPLPVFGLLLAGLYVRRPRRAWPSAPTAVVATILVYFLAMIMRSRLNMGFRHMMPAVPLLTILAARGFEKTWDHVVAGTRTVSVWGRALLGAALAWMPATAMIAAPSYLGWFNAAVGRDRGHWISIIGEDWNQDMLRAARRAVDAGYEPLYIVPHTTVSKRELAWAEIDYIELGCKDLPQPGSYVILRAAVAKTRRGACHLWSVGREPIEDIADHMYIYRIPEDAAYPIPADAEPGEYALK